MHDGIDLRKVKRIGLASILIVIVVVAAAAALTSRWDEDPPGGVSAPPRAWIKGPLLETSPQADLARYLQEKNRLLHEYGWVDRQAGIARIPLDQAMQAMAEQAATGAARVPQPAGTTREPAGTPGPGATPKTDAPDDLIGRPKVDGTPKAAGNAKEAP
jgi:hypothetical protein